MTKVLVTERNLQDIASAIRSKNGSNDSYRPGDMAAAIRAIPTGGTLVSKTITQNGSYDAEDDNADGYSDVTVNVTPTLQAKIATQNGTVTPDSGYDGLSQVAVNVQGGGDVDIEVLTLTKTSIVSSILGSAVRIGNVVFFSGRFNISSQASGWRQMASLPSGIVPVVEEGQQNVGFMAGHGGSVAVRDGNINTNGEILIYTESSDSYLYANFMFVIDEQGE